MWSTIESSIFQLSKESLMNYRDEIRLILPPEKPTNTIGRPSSVDVHISNHASPKTYSELLTFGCLCRGVRMGINLANRKIPKDKEQPWSEMLLNLFDYSVSLCAIRTFISPYSTNVKGAVSFPSHVWSSYSEISIDIYAQNTTTIQSHRH